MKKILLVGLAALGMMSLTGCEMIQGLINGEKKYNEADFKVLIADKHFAFSVTKCHGVRDVNGEKTERDYTYDSSDGAWHYTYMENIGGTEFEAEGSLYLDVINDVKDCDSISKLVKQSVDSIFKFYTTKDGFKITANYQTDDQKTELKFLYNSDGLATSRYSKTTFLDSVKSTEKTETFTYSN